jgi:signal transduction histidine kinase
VQGDTINIQRIAQNLILNALKYTGKGGVTVVWEALETEGVQRWAFSIEDTGPGFQSSSEAPLAHAIEASTLEAAAVEQSAVEGSQPTTSSESSLATSRALFRRGVAQPPGEGVGLAIVKRLCELLDATLELKTDLGQGSVFRVVLPRSYDPD